MKYLQILCIAALFITSCGKDNDSEQIIEELAPQVQLSVEAEQLEITPGDELTLTAISSDGRDVTHQWKLNGEVVSNVNTFTYAAITEGVYTVIYTAKNKAGEFSKTYTISVGVNIRPVTKESNMYVVNLFEYKPAPGQNTNRVNGNLASAKGVLGKQGLISLGAFGGYIVLGFDHTVINRPGQDDLIIYCNAFANFSEPGIVWVMRDDNGNGLPDDTWYELAGSEFGKDGYERNYTITYHKPAADTDPVNWTDNKGASGQILNIKKAAYFPLTITGTEYSLTGSKLKAKTRMTGSFYNVDAYEWGYADDSAAGRDNFDIANAIDANGNKVNLTGVDFVKVQTAALANLGALGELSTEIKSVADLSLVP